ncbi:hypothetical protein POM88_027444 [Heracleum sosnowskyi]|uniref:Nodulin homeobox N-terminal domain-containing protein n=1 Tax=Heracleum sosnowskyi TaxID=360622 RepID=A0AAD8MLH1_9APIA|nr:hypothetical protein POM88_027444 [Heracleum sosnowskyi]
MYRITIALYWLRCAKAYGLSCNRLRTKVSVTMLLVEFESIWCKRDLFLWEEDATFDYDPFVAAGWVLNSFSNIPVTGSFTSTYTYNMPRDSYTAQRTSLLVKIIANLHCFAPDIYEDEKDMFLNNLFSCLQKEIFKSSDGASEKASDASKNIGSLLNRAESLRNSYLSEQDVQILG